MKRDKRDPKKRGPKTGTPEFEIDRLIRAAHPKLSRAKVCAKAELNHGFIGDLADGRAALPENMNKLADALAELTMENVAVPHIFDPKTGLLLPAQSGRRAPMTATGLDSEQISYHAPSPDPVRLFVHQLVARLIKVHGERQSVLRIDRAYDIAMREAEDLRRAIERAGTDQRSREALIKIVVDDEVRRLEGDEEDPPSRARK